MLIVSILKDKGEKVYSLSGEATLEEAARELNARRVGAIVVLDAEGALSGVLSERDIVREIAKSGPKALSQRVSDAMTKAVITATPEETVDAGMARMTDRRVRHLPVIAGGKLVGIISIGDLVKRKIEEAEAHAEAMKSYIAAG
jgi:CBS domain-containing protein